MLGRAIVVAGAVGIIGCATVLNIHTEDTLVATRHIVTEGRDRILSVTVLPRKDGATLVFASSETCSKSEIQTFRRVEVTERDFGFDTHRDEGEFDSPSEPHSFPCNRTIIARRGIAFRFASGQQDLDLGTTDEGGTLTIRWGDLAPEVVGMTVPSSATIIVKAGSSQGSNAIELEQEFDLSASREFLGRRALAEATRLATDDRVDEATSRAQQAKALGADTALVMEAIEAAPTSVRRRERERERDRTNQAFRAKQLLVNAWASLRNADLISAAQASRDAAALGLEDKALNDAIDQVRIAAEKKVEVDKQKKLRAQEESIREAQSKCTEAETRRLFKQRCLGMFALNRLVGSNSGEPQPRDVNRYCICASLRPKWSDLKKFIGASDCSIGVMTSLNYFDEDVVKLACGY